MLPSAPLHRQHLLVYASCGEKGHMPALYIEESGAVPDDEAARLLLAWADLLSPWTFEVHGEYDAIRKCIHVQALHVDGVCVASSTLQLLCSCMEV